MPKIWMNLWSTIASFFWYNAELQIIIIIIIMAKKKTDNVQNQPRHWATCKDVHFGQFGEQQPIKIQ